MKTIQLFRRYFQALAAARRRLIAISDAHFAVAAILKQGTGRTRPSITGNKAAAAAASIAARCQCDRQCARVSDSGRRLVALSSRYSCAHRRRAQISRCSSQIAVRNSGTTAVVARASPPPPWTRRPPATACAWYGAVSTNRRMRLSLSLSREVPIPCYQFYTQLVIT